MILLIKNYFLFANINTNIYNTRLNVLVIIIYTIFFNNSDLEWSFMLVSMQHSASTFSGGGKMPVANTGLQMKVYYNFP